MSCRLQRYVRYPLFNRVPPLLAIPPNALVDPLTPSLGRFAYMVLGSWRALRQLGAHVQRIRQLGLI